MIKPPIEELLENSPGRFALVITSARRAKDINSYFNQLGEGIGAYTPPQVPVSYTHLTLPTILRV